MSSTVIQISRELEEAARIQGASWIQSFRHIILPLLSRGFLAGWIVVFAYTVKDVPIVLMLRGPGTQVIATQVFDWWRWGAIERAIVLGVLEAGLLSLVFLGAQLLRIRLGGRGAR
jgi:iron(III) transport system permease protein